MLVSLALACSCLSCGSVVGGVKPASELCIVRLDSNILPLKMAVNATDSNGFTARFEVQSTDCFCNSTPFLVCSRFGGFSVSVNGKLVHPMASIHILNGEDCCYNVSGILREGLNEMEISGSGEVPQVFISGDFSVDTSDGDVWTPAPSRTLELGSLVWQGMPFYPGQVAYVRKFEVPENVGRRVMCIPDWSGSSCEIWINDKKVADVVGKPYRKNVGPYLAPGQNSVEVRISGQPLSGSEGPAPSDLGLLEDFTIE